MVMATVLLALLLAAAAVRMLLLRKNLRAAARDLTEINGGLTRQPLRLASPDRGLEGLFAQINALLLQKQEGDARHRQAEDRLRQEIANISHDLRTPLTSILGYVQLLRDGECTQAEREEYLAVIHARAQALQILITGFYDLSLLDAGGYVFEKQAVYLDRVLYELAAAFYVDFSDRQMEPVIECAEGLPAICADVQAVKRIYTNLFQNALKHGKGIVHIAACWEGGRVITRFANQAPNLKAGDIPHLFDRFYTADTMRTGRNTGLGLAIVKRLAQQMDGEVSASLQGGALTLSLGWPVMPEHGRTPAGRDR